MTGTKEKVKDAYEEGFEASMNEKKEDANPYMRGTDDFQAWLEGHRFGEESWLDLCAREVRAGRPHPDSI